MTTLVWLAASSLAWGAVLWFTALVLQRHNDLSGRARQWIWRGATLLLVAPWIAAPVVGMLGLGLAPSNAPAAASMLVAQALPADLSVVASAVDAANVTTAAIKSENAFLLWLKGLAFGEMLILAIMAGWIVRFVAAQLSTRALLGIVAASRVAEAGLARGSLSVWSARLGLKRQPELRIVAPGVSPFSFGVLKPVICLPEGLEHKLGREALDLVVGHECLHVSRGDGWRRPLERFCADVFWFNPFAWAMRRELDMARELACDEGVVEVSAARHAYARTLRDVAGITAGLSASLPAASMSLAGSGRSLVVRVKRTLEQAKRKPARVALAAAVALGAAGACTSVGQAMLATPAAERGTEVVTLAPAEVTFAGKLDKEGWYVELKQAGGEIGEAKANTCLVEAWRFDKLNVKTGQMLKSGAVVGTGKPLVSSDLVCRDMITGAGAEYALDPRREPGGMRYAPKPSQPIRTNYELPDQVAPPAPPSPPVPATPRAQPAAEAPEAPQLTPVAPSAPPRPTPLVSPAPTPQVAPVPPVAPTPAVPALEPTKLLRLPAGPDGLTGEIVTAFPAKIISVASNPEDGFNIRMIQYEGPDGAGGCTLFFSRTAEARVETGQDVKPGDIIGVGGAEVLMGASCNNSDGSPGTIMLAPRQPGGVGGRRMPDLAGAPAAVLDAPAKIISSFGFRVDPFNTEGVSFHEGVDLGTELYAPVHAPGAGTVTFAGTKGGYGRVVELTLNKNSKVRFAHLNEIRVEEGDKVKAGAVIGTAGSTGRSSSPHLHLEFYFNGKAYDPEKVKGLTLTRP